MNKRKLKSKVYRNLATMTLQHYWSLLDEVVFGYIHLHHHPENPNIVMLNFTKSAIEQKRMNSEILLASNLILDITDATINGIVRILAVPNNRYLSLGEDFEKEEALEVVSYFYENELHFASKKDGFDCALVRRATAFWRDYHQHYLDFSYYSTFPSTYHLRVELDGMKLVGVYYNEMAEFFEYAPLEIQREAYKLNLGVA